MLWALAAQVRLDTRLPVTRGPRCQRGRHGVFMDRDGGPSLHWQLSQGGQRLAQMPRAWLRVYHGAVSSQPPGP
jgi:hypothetical protein